MTIEAGTELLHYQLIEKLGEGGMGVVWKAIDTTLDREVAIKILPQILGDDTERLERFEREAKVLASLNHPNIAAIYALESKKAGAEAGHYKDGGTTGAEAHPPEAGAEAPPSEAGHHEGIEAEGPFKFLVMELVSGEDLSERLARGPVPVDEAIHIARNIAQALEVAHESGIIHRDLKPANIRITESDEVKVLDFGLAKALSAGTETGRFSSGSNAGESISVSMSPTLTAAGTMPGIILGTAAYMSPEQARGKPVDRRADVWAFGCVLYEMLTAHRLFHGETISDILADVLKTEIDWHRLPSATPSSVRRLLRRCLTRDPSQRLRDLGDAQLELAEAEEDTEPGQPVAPAISSTPAWQRWLPWGVAGIAAILGIAGWMMPQEEVAAPPTETVRFQIDIGSRDLTTGDVSFNFSPDGQTLAYATNLGTSSQIFLRRLDQLEAIPLDGTEDGHAPFFSPDGQWIGFFSNNQMLKVPIVGGRPKPLATLAHAPGGADWVADGTIIFATAFAAGEGLSRVSADGGTIEHLTTPNSGAGEAFHHWPQMLPDQQHVLFSINGQNRERVAIMSLTSGEWRELPEVNGRARYVPSGFILFGESETLLAVPFDLERLETTGSPFVIRENLPILFGGGAGASMQISATGNLAYLGAIGPQQTMVWVDRQGQVTPLPIERGSFHWPQISHDETRLALSNFHRYSMTIHNLARGGQFEIEDGIYGIWESGDEHIVFTSFRTGTPQIFRQRSDATTDAIQLLETGLNNIVTSITPDGKFVAYYEQHPETGRDIWVLDLEGDGTPEPILVDAPNERSARFSPDGKWLAYTSNRSGRDEVYIRRFEPRSQEDTLVSTDGGREPVWNPAGSEIFYRAGRSILTVPIELEPRVEVGTPKVLFEGDWAIDPGGLNQMYDVSSDGESFLMIRNDDNLGLVNIVVNWTPEPL